MNMKTMELLLLSSLLVILVVLPKTSFYPNPVRLCPLASNRLVNTLELIPLEPAQTT